MITATKVTGVKCRKDLTKISIYIYSTTLAVPFAPSHTMMSSPDANVDKIHRYTHHFLNMKSNYSTWMMVLWPVLSRENWPVPLLVAKSDPGFINLEETSPCPVKLVYMVCC